MFGKIPRFPFLNHFKIYLNDFRQHHIRLRFAIKKDFTSKTRNLTTYWHLRLDFNNSWDWRNCQQKKQYTKNVPYLHNKLPRFLFVPKFLFCLITYPSMSGALFKDPANKWVDSWSSKSKSCIGYSMPRKLSLSHNLTSFITFYSVYVYIKAKETFTNE